MALMGTRNEDPIVNHQLVEQDVKSLHGAGTGTFGTVSVFLRLFSTVSFHRGGGGKWSDY